MEEDDQLTQNFDAGKSVRELTGIHQRTTAAVQARLEKLGKLEPSFKSVG